MRLTSKIGYFDHNNNLIESSFYVSNKLDNFNECINKLGKLEDIEDLFGIDLDTLFKAITCGIYVKTKKFNGFVEGDEIRLASHLSYLLNFNNYKSKTLLTGIKLIFGKTGICLDGFDYGKRWALTKEELDK